MSKYHSIFCTENLNDGCYYTLTLLVRQGTIPLEYAETMVGAVIEEHIIREMVEYMSDGA